MAISHDTAGGISKIRSARFNGTADEQWQIIWTLHRRLHLDRLGRLDVRRPVHNKTERALGTVLTQQHHRPRKIRVGQLGHGDQERWR